MIHPQNYRTCQASSLILVKNAMIPSTRTISISLKLDSCGSSSKISSMELRKQQQGLRKHPLTKAIEHQRLHRKNQADIGTFRHFSSDVFPVWVIALPKRLHNNSQFGIVFCRVKPPFTDRGAFLSTDTSIYS